MDFALLETLRQRREFPCEEVSRLLRGLPALLDRAPVEDHPLLQNLWISMPGGANRNLGAESVLQWPAFTLEFRRVATPSPREIAGGATVFAKPTAKSAVFRLAELIYELLGGRKRAGLDEFRPPLAALKSEANAVLQRVFSGKNRGSCEGFWQEWTLSCGMAPIPAIIPSRFLGSAQAGTLLELKPDDPSLAPTRFVTGDRFRIGRSSQDADWVARFLPAGPETEALNEQISRVHLLAECSSGGVILRDGDGSKSSTNGSFWNGKALSTLPIEQRGTLRLGASYALEVVPIWGVDAEEISNLSEWSGAESPQAPILREKPAALLFSPPAGQLVYRNALWLFSRIGFDLAESGAFLWQSGSTAAASFLFAHGGFWLLHHQRMTVTLDGIPLQCAEIAPLVSGQSWKIGPINYTIRIR